MLRGNPESRRASLSSHIRIPTASQTRHRSRQDKSARLCVGAGPRPAAMRRAETAAATRFLKPTHGGPKHDRRKG